jgi:hypothetical protein
MMKKTVLTFAGCLLSMAGAVAQTVVFDAEFDGSSAVSGSVTVNASAANLNAGTSVGSWTLPGSEPGAIISDGGTDNAFVFDKATSGSAANEVSANFSRAVDLYGGEALTLELDLYAARQSGGQLVRFSLDDADGSEAYQFVFEMNNDKRVYAVNASGQSVESVVNATGVNNGYKNAAVDGYLDWGATMIHVRLEVSSQPAQAGNYGAKLSVDWNGDGDYDDSGELLDADIGARNTGVTEISSLRIANDDSVNGGAWIDNISVTAAAGDVSPHSNHFNLAKYQPGTADSYASDKPDQFANDGFVAQDSRWVSTGAGPHWLEIELAVPMTIGSAHLFSGGTWNSAMADFVLQYDDGGSWVDIAGTDVSGNTIPELNLTFDAPVTAQTFRLYTTDDTARVTDLALYPPTDDGAMVPFGTDVILNLAGLRQVEGSSIDGVNYSKLAVDGYADDASCWVGDAGTQALEILWLQAEKVRGIHLYSGYEGQSGTRIEDFNVDYWDSTASNWVTFANGSVTGNTELEREVRFDAAVEVTKIRIQSLDADAPVIREVVVLPENNGAGYPLWTGVADAAAPTGSFMTFDDSFYTIENRGAGLNLSTASTGSVLTAEAPTFQILLNVGTDTYRLRSADSGACFEVSLASTNEGAAIVEGTYSGMPHQRWRLVDSGDGTHFRIVNVWSGLALDVEGGAAVQKSITADASQEWSFDYQTHVPKKGQVAFFHYNTMYRPSWFYSWSATAEDDCEYGDYHPMQWGWMTGTAPTILRYQADWYGRSQLTCAMGFNEPDKEEQSNIPEEDAADQWLRLERMQLPLVGPCPAQRDSSWRQAYEALADERGLRSEYMAMHWYAGCNDGNPDNIISSIQSLYNKYGKPVWLTEFAVKDWYSTGTWTRNDNFNWLAEFLWRAEGLDCLKKYSIFEWGVEDNNDDPTVGDGPTMGLHLRNDKNNPGYEDLSELGLMLAGWDGNTNILNETEYIIHNKGRHLRLIDDPASNTVTYADILHRSGTDQWMFQTAPNGNKYIVGVNDGRRLHYDGSSVGLSAAGTTGSSVEWELNEYQYGWFYIDHPSTAKRLRITSGFEINVESSGSSYDALMFRFIKPGQPLGIAETQSLPYSESFEEGMGGWVQSAVDDYDWRRNSGGTPTDSAGPAGASDGDWYLYAEGHDAYDGYRTSSVQCTFDLSGVSAAEMSFDYHMYGTYIDFLSVDVDDGSGWSSNVWTRSGQQHTGTNDAWSTATVDLTAYAGSAAVTLRFRTKIKEWNAADPAIDNIRLAQTTAVELTVPVAAAEPGDGSVTLSWSASTGSAPITYTVQRGTVSGGPYAELTTGISSTGYTDHAVTNEITYYYAVYATDAASQNSALSDEVSATPSTSFGPYGIWAATAFSEAPEGTDTTATGNPDGDSNSNELEWILATDPLTADSPVTAMNFSAPNLIITYTRRKLDGVSVYAEVSPALLQPGWVTTGFTEVVIGDDGEVETVAVILPYEEIDQNFIRLRVAQ